MRSLALLLSHRNVPSCSLTATLASAAFTCKVLAGAWHFAHLQVGISWSQGTAPSICWPAPSPSVSPCLPCVIPVSSMHHTCVIPVSSSVSYVHRLAAGRVSVPMSRMCLYFCGPRLCLPASVCLLGLGLCSAAPPQLSVRSVSVIPPLVCLCPTHGHPAAPHGAEGARAPGSVSAQSSRSYREPHRWSGPGPCSRISETSPTWRDKSSRTQRHGHTAPPHHTRHTDTRVRNHKWVCQGSLLARALHGHFHLWPCAHSPSSGHSCHLTGTEQGHMRVHVVCMQPCPHT